MIPVKGIRPDEDAGRHSNRRPAICHGRLLNWPWASFLVGILIISLSGCTGTPLQTAATPNPAVELTPCQVASPGATSGLDASCGRLEVAEDPSLGNTAAAGRKISLYFAVRPASDKNPEPDPLFFIPGGPGEAATQSFPQVALAFRKINQKHDIVLLDQRGTGSSHPLLCPDETSAPGSEPVQALVEKCLAGLDADPRFYTTSAAVSDLEQARQALGYTQINLYGASYGTRVALAYLRQYPDRVRTVILDGVDPPNWTLGPLSARNAQRAIDRLFDRCVHSPDCGQSFPDLPSHFQAVLQRLEEAPIQVQIPDPDTGAFRSIQMDRQAYADTIFSLSYTAETATLIPLLIDTTYRQQDYSLVARQKLLLEGQIGESISSGMRFSVICTEDQPFFDQEPASTGYLGNSFTPSFQAICSVWPHDPAPPEFKNPVVSSVPVLLISGENDPVTPPSNAELAARTLENSTQLVVPGQGHINIFRGCVPNLAAAFVETGDPSQLNPQCAQDIQPLPFFINFSGPAP